MLSALLLLIYFQFFAPSPVPGVEDGTAENTEVASDPRSQRVTGSQGESIQPSNTTDSAQQTLSRQKYGAFASAMSGEDQDITLENEDLIVTLSTRGGQLKKVTLKKYNAYQSGPVVLLDEASSTIDRRIATQQGLINLNDLYFTADTPALTVAAGDTSQVVLTAPLADGSSIKQIYTLAGESYQVGYQLSVPNSGQLLTEQTLDFVWKDDLKVVEKDPEESRRRSQMNYYTAEGDMESLSSLTGEGNEEETITVPLKWIAMKQRFFTSAILTDQTFPSAELSSQQPPEGENVVKYMSMDVAMPLNN